MPRVALRPESVVRSLKVVNEPPSAEHEDGKCGSSAKLMRGCGGHSDHVSHGAAQAASFGCAAELSGTKATTHCDVMGTGCKGRGSSAAATSANDPAEKITPRLSSHSHSTVQSNPSSKDALAKGCDIQGLSQGRCT